jgi:hypothetical protein
MQGNKVQNTESPTVYRVKKLKSGGQGPTMGCRVTDNNNNNNSNNNNNNNNNNNINNSVA